MNLFFAYCLAVCPALNDVICVLMGLCGVFLVLGFIVVYNYPDLSIEHLKARVVVAFCVKTLLVLALLWAFVPSQKRLNAMMLNYHAGCVDMRDEYGVRK